MLKQTLVASVISMGMFAGSAYAHVEQPVTGDPVNFSEGELVWNAGNTVATATATVGNNNIIAFDFSVFTGGVVDLFGNDFQNLNTQYTSIYLFKPTGHHGGLENIAASFNGDEANFTTPRSSVNTYGVPVTGWIDVNNAGNPEAGMTLELQAGNYTAMLVSSEGLPLSFLAEEPVIVGYEYAAGWSWNYLGQSNFKPLGDYGLTLRVAANSSAVIGATPPVSEVPVPGAVWLMGSVLAGFGAFGRKKAAISA